MPGSLKSEKKLEGRPGSEPENRTQIRTKNRPEIG